MAFPSDRLFAVSNRWMVIDGGLSFCSTKRKPKSTLSYYIVEFEIWNRGGFSIEFWNNDRGLILAANAVVYRSVSLAPWLGYLRVSSVFSIFARPSATPLRVFSTSFLSKSADKIEALLSNPKQTTVFITKTVHCKNVFQRALLYTLS